MIKINLMKSFGNSSSEVLQQLDEQKSVQTTFAKNIAVVLLGVVGLFAYEQYIIPQLTTEQTSLQAEVADLTAFNQKKEALKLEIEKYEKDRLRLNRQTEFLQKIQRERMLSVKFLKKIQEVIPQGVWLTSVKVDAFQIEIKGEADSEREINEFNLKLAEVHFLTDVVILSIDLKLSDTNKQVSIKNFSMQAKFSDQPDAAATNEVKQ